MACLVVKFFLSAISIGVIQKNTFPNLHKKGLTALNKQRNTTKLNPKTIQNDSEEAIKLKGNFLQHCQTIIIILLISTYLLKPTFFTFLKFWFYIHMHDLCLHTTFRQLSCQYVFQPCWSHKIAGFLKKYCFKSNYFLTSSSLNHHLVPIPMMLPRILLCSVLLNLETFHYTIV